MDHTSPGPPTSGLLYERNKFLTCAGWNHCPEFSTSAETQLSRQPVPRRQASSGFSFQLRLTRWLGQSHFLFLSLVLYSLSHESVLSSSHFAVLRMGGFCFMEHSSLFASPKLFPFVILNNQKHTGYITSPNYTECHNVLL